MTVAGEGLEDGASCRGAATMKNKAHSIALAVGLVWSAGAAAQSAPDGVTVEETTWEQAVAILEKVDAAAKAVHSVSYHGSFRGTGWLAGRVAQVEGTAVIGGMVIRHRRSRGFERFHFDVRVRESGSEEVKRFTAGHDGEVFFLIDWQARTVHANDVREVLGSDGRLAQTIGMIEFVHPTPFTDEIDGDEVELVGMELVGDQECHVIDVVYAFGRGQARWYFSKKDLLPRRVDRVYYREGERATTELVVTNLVVDPPLESAELQPFVPDGFERTERFAMDRAAAQRNPPLLKY